MLTRGSLGLGTYETHLTQGSMYFGGLQPFLDLYRGSESRVAQFRLLASS